MWLLSIFTIIRNCVHSGTYTVLGIIANVEKLLEVQIMQRGPCACIDVGTGRYIVIHKVHIKLMYGIFHMCLYTACGVYRSCERLWLSDMWKSMVKAVASKLTETWRLPKLKPFESLHPSTSFSKMSNSIAAVHAVVISVAICARALHACRNLARFVACIRTVATCWLHSRSMTDTQTHEHTGTGRDSTQD